MRSYVDEDVTGRDGGEEEGVVGGVEKREREWGRGLSEYSGSCACAAAGKQERERMAECQPVQNQSMFGVVCAHVGSMLHVMGKGLLVNINATQCYQIVYQAARSWAAVTMEVRSAAYQISR